MAMAPNRNVLSGSIGTFITRTTPPKHNDRDHWRHDRNRRQATIQVQGLRINQPDERRHCREQTTDIGYRANQKTTGAR